MDCHPIKIYLMRLGGYALRCTFTLFIQVYTSVIKVCTFEAIELIFKKEASLVFSRTLPMSQRDKRKKRMFITCALTEA